MKKADSPLKWKQAAEGREDLNSAWKDQSRGDEWI